MPAVGKLVACALGKEVAFFWLGSFTIISSFGRFHDSKYIRCWWAICLVFIIPSQSGCGKARESVPHHENGV